MMWFGSEEVPIGFLVVGAIELMQDENKRNHGV